MTGRTVPFRINAPRDLTSLGVRLSQESPAAEITATVELKADETEQNWGLFVPLARDATVWINGRHVEAEPILRTDGAVFSIPAAMLTAGDNSIKIQRLPIKPTAASWSETTLFSLEEAEEMHFGMAFAEAAFAPRDSAPPTADQQKYDALWYDLFIEPDFQAAIDNSAPNTVRRSRASRITSASLTMGGKNVSGTPLSSVVLDFDRNPAQNADFSPGSLTGMDISGVDRGPGTAPITLFTHDNATHRMTIPLPVPIAAGEEFQVRVFYSGYPDVFYQTPGGYNQIAQAYTGSTHGGGNPVIFTANQPYGARRWFPCKDVTVDKATTTTMRIRIPWKDDNTDGKNDYGTMSNGLLKSRTYEAGTNTELNVWENSYPIATYLMAFYASNYLYSDGELHTNLDGTTMPIQHAIYPQNVTYEGNAAPGTRQILTVFSQLFGDYPFKREKYGTASWNITFGIENQNATGMPGGLSGNTLGNGLTDRNIHEIAHMWWGDNVTYSDFDHLWLGEGFATHAEALFREFRSGGTFADYKARMAFYRTAAVASPTTPLVSPAGEGVLNNTFYRRGAWVVHMLRRVLGDEVFFDVLRTYQDTLAGTSTDSAGFQAVAEAVSGRNLAPFFTQWLTRTNLSSAPTFPGYRFQTAVTQTAGNYKISLQVDQTQGGAVGNAFVMPLEFWVTDGVTQTSFTVENSQYTQSFEIPLGTTLPLEIDFDPDEWILRSYQLNINTVALPSAVASEPYAATLRASGPGTPYSWSASGLPAGLTISSAGVVSGTAPAQGVYQFTATVNGSRSNTVYLNVGAEPLAPPPSVVINEVFYDAVPDPDSGEFIELKNITASPVDISGWKVVLVDGATGEAYGPTPIVIPSTTVVPAGGYYVIGNVPGANLATNLDDVLQNGTPDAIVLRDSGDKRIDSLNYEADAPFAAGSDRLHAVAEGGTGTVRSTTLGAADNNTIGRLPDGVDTDNNLLDFANIPASPGSANSASVILPFSDNFDTAPAPAWRKGFTAVQSGTPPTPSPQGGLALKVVDPTGGGDVAFLAGDWSRINLEGYLYIPADATNAWNVGIGVATRSEANWFSGSSGQGMENGVYLMYENGTVSPALKNGAVPAASYRLRLVAVSSAATVNSGPGSAQTTVLGSVLIPLADTAKWVRFRLAFNGNTRQVAAYLNGSTTPFNSTLDIPLGCNRSGGVTIGFREHHIGQPVAGEATWVDGLVINNLVGTDVPVTLGGFMVE